MQLYRSLVLSKLLYGLQFVWLPKLLRRQIDGFHCGCLRQILGIPHPYISRVSNAQVLQQARDIPLHLQLLRQQLQYYGTITRNAQHPTHTILRNKIVKRRIGRPHLSWDVEIAKHIQNMHVDNDCVQHPGHWRKVVKQYCAIDV